MSDVILDLAAIKARAEAATPGPWFTTCAPWFQSEDGVLAGSPDGNIAFMIADCESFAASRDEYEGPFKLSAAEADAAHIAGMDPPTTLALVAEVERLRARVAELEAGLKPLAADAELFHERVPDTVGCGMGFSGLKVGDFRRAASLLSAPSPTPASQMEARHG